MICIEGPPGSGKAAIAKALSKRKKLPLVAFRPATADLMDLQADNERWSFYTSLKIACDRIEAMRQAPSECIMVGSPASDIHCYARISAMLPCEQALFTQWMTVLQKGLPNITHILVATAPQESFAAVFHGARREQAHHTLKYIKELHQLYMEAFEAQPTVHLPLSSSDNDLMLQDALSLALHDTQACA